MKKFDLLVYKKYFLTLKIDKALEYLLETKQEEEFERLDSLLKNRIILVGDELIDKTIFLYQNYWQNIFLAQSQRNKKGLSELEQEARVYLAEKLAELYLIEENDIEKIEEVIESKLGSLGYHFMGGRTSLVYGPYIWSDTVTKIEQVEILDELFEVEVCYLDKFQCKSWLDWLSDGRFGTAGWAENQQLFCILEAYNYETTSEKFQVSFLKHETQHFNDYQYAEITNAELEYRAKLIELIYYTHSNFLNNLIQMADMSQIENGHPYASGKILMDLALIMGKTQTYFEQMVHDEGLWQSEKMKVKQAAQQLLIKDTVRLKQS